MHLEHTGGRIASDYCIYHALTVTATDRRSQRGGLGEREQKKMTSECMDTGRCRGVKKLFELKI